MPMIEKNESLPIEYTLSVLGGKWKILILYYLMTEKVQRYGELKHNVTGITHKMLSMQLKELETEGLISRREYRQIPPKVEYSLTPSGTTLLPLLEQMYDWGKENMNKDSLGFETAVEHDTRMYATF